MADTPDPPAPVLEADLPAPVPVPSRSARRRRERTATTYVFRVIVSAYLLLLVAWPVSLVAQKTFEDGTTSLRGILEDPDVLHALRLTVTIAAISVVINTVFGVGMSLLLVRYEFPGKRLLSALIDLPLSVSPVVVGLALVLVYGGRSGWFGPTLESAGFQVIFAVPGMVMATVFVALPLVIREVAGGVVEIVGKRPECFFGADSGTQPGDKHGQLRPAHCRLMAWGR